MTAHVLVPAIDERRIASFSPVIVQHWLKQSLGFAGVVVSDDLGMKAVSATMTLAEAAVAAIQAGCDAVLLCNSTVEEQVGALEALIRAAESGEIAPTRIDDAMKRQHDGKVRMRRSDAAAVRLAGCGGVHGASASRR